MSEDLDLDAVETREWMDALGSVTEFEGTERAGFLVRELVTEARRIGVPVPYSANTPYLNTIPPDQEPPYPGDLALERRIRSLTRWNAVAIVLRANKDSSELGGHIASYQSAATLYDVGYQHFWHAPGPSHGGDLVLIQGHSSPGIYARAFLEGRLSEEQMLDFREEVGGHGLSSYPASLADARVLAVPDRIHGARSPRPWSRRRPVRRRRSGRGAAARRRVSGDCRIHSRFARNRQFTGRRCHTAGSELAARTGTAPPDPSITGN